MKRSNQKVTAKVKSISKQLSLSIAPDRLFQKLQAKSPGPNRMLLQSSEIESNRGVKSLLMLTPALRIECNSRKIELIAQSANGIQALAAIKPRLVRLSHFEIERSTKGALSMQLIPEPRAADEDQRLLQPTPLDALRQIQNSFETPGQNDYSVFLCGVVAFDLINSIEAIEPLEAGDNTCPDYVFYLAESLLAYDHSSETCRLYSNHFSGKGSEQTFNQLAQDFNETESLLHSLNKGDEEDLLSQVGLKAAPELSQVNQIAVDISDAQFATQVTQLKQQIIQGQVFQVVPSRCFSVACADPVLSYRQLKQQNPSPYLFYMADQAFDLFGASPESAVSFDTKTNRVSLYPIAGTRPRGRLASGEIDADFDSRIELELKQDEKEIAEHMMLVDLARNDVARISKVGSLQLPKLMQVDRYSQVMHLVSSVSGELKPELDALGAYQACLNMGTLTGAPKVRATQLLQSVEGKRRGSYGGAVGYLNGRGDMDTCIVIRSAFCKDGTAYVQAGAGVVFDSDPVAEANETKAKASAVLGAVQAANQLVAQQQQRMSNGVECHA